MTKEYYALIVLTPSLQSADIMQSFIDIDNIKLEVVSSNEEALSALKKNNFDLMFFCTEKLTSEANSSLSELISSASLVYTIFVADSIYHQDSVKLLRMGVSGSLKTPLHRNMLVEELNKFAMRTLDCVGFK